MASRLKNRSLGWITEQSLLRPPGLACSPGSHHMLLARAETRRESARRPGSPEPAQSRPGERGRRGRRVTRLTDSDSPSQPKSPLQSHEPPETAASRLTGTLLGTVLPGGVFKDCVSGLGPRTKGPRVQFPVKGTCLRWQARPLLGCVRGHQSMCLSPNNVLSPSLPPPPSPPLPLKKKSKEG